MKIAYIFLFIFQMAIASAEICSNVNIERAKNASKFTEKCRAFQNSWVRDYRISRHPMEIVREIDALIDRSVKNIEYAKCVDDMTKRKALLTEPEIIALRELSTKTTISALKDGADKARLKYETEKTYLTLRKSLFETPDKTKAKERSIQVPIVFACTRLLDEKYADLIFYMEQPTNGSSGKKNPKSNKTLEKTEL